MLLRAMIQSAFMNISACALLIAGFSSPTFAENKYVLKLGHALASESHFQLTALEFARLVQQTTRGNVEVQVFPQSQLGGEVQMTQAVRS